MESERNLRDPFRNLEEFHLRKSPLVEQTTKGSSFKLEENSKGSALGISKTLTRNLIKSHEILKHMKTLLRESHVESKMDPHGHIKN